MLPTASPATQSSPGPAGDVNPDSRSSSSKRTKRSLLSAGVYSLGFTVQRAIGLIMLPVYTSVLTPEDYGDLGLLMAAYIGVGIIFSVGLETSITRNYFQLANDSAARQAYIDSIWRFLVRFPLAASAGLAAIAWLILGSDGSIDGPAVTLMLLAAAANAAATTLPLAILRARQALGSYLWMTAVFAIGTTGLTVIFVVVLGQGIRGWFMAAFLANLALLLTASVVVPWNRRGSLQWPIVGAAVLFSLPLLPHFASHWALQMADRGVVAGLVSRADLGTYTLAANIAGIVMMLVMALNQAFAPTYARAGATTGHEQELANTVVLQITAVVTLTLAASLLGPIAVQLLTGPEYHGASKLVPWLVLGYGFLGVYFVPMNGATLGAGRRTYAWVATAASAMVNILLLIVLVPNHGIEAAAIASAIGYLTLLVLLAIWAHSGANPVRYDWRRILPTVATAVLAYVAASSLAPDGRVASLAASVGWVATFLVIAVGMAVGKRRLLTPRR